MKKIYMVDSEIVRPPKEVQHPIPDNALKSTQPNPKLIFYLPTLVVQF